MSEKHGLEIAAEIAEAVVKEMLLPFLVETMLARLVAMVPFFAFPIINPLVAYVVGKIGMWAYKSFDLIVDFKVIEFREAAKNEAYQAAVRDLFAKLNKENPNQQEIDESYQQFKDRARDLIRMQPVT